MSLRNTPEAAEKSTAQSDQAPALTEQKQEVPPPNPPHHADANTSHTTHLVTEADLRAADSTLVFTETLEKAKVYIRANCAPVLSVYNTAFLPYDGSYQSSNRALLGFTAISAMTYARGDSTVALISTGFAAYFAVSSACQRGFSESVKAFATSGTKLITGACRLGINLFNGIKKMTSREQPAADIKMKRT